MHGASHWKSGDCRDVYAAFLTDVARYEQAEALLLSAYPVLRDTLGSENVRTKRSLNHLVELYEAWEKPDEAARFRALLPEVDAPEE